MTIVEGTSLIATGVFAGFINTVSGGGSLLTLPLLIFLGVYRGFIQAGIGFLIIASLTAIHGFKMAKTNAIKVFVALTYTIASLIIFHLNGKIRWEYGLVLAIGNAGGQYKKVTR